MKSQDIVILLKLASLRNHDNQNASSQNVKLEEYSVRSLEASLGISKTEVSASINRSLSSGLATKDRKSRLIIPSRRNLTNFITHGLKFVFPVKLGSMQRGLPTAFDAPGLQGKLFSAGEVIHVWPYAKGTEMGQSITPLFKSVPEAALRDHQLYDYLALIDAIRLGNQREAKLASDLLSERLQQSW
ncbi:hypothetical protein [Pseudovibrio brasiliensis]|uniref:Uncharacterized protein n=1 Tax=Pseudovibrio brasiliensis TaxID=1898042 RepID=A0ABX8AWU3_9HYPH|nr:hypothetical protein [Pseudovibrio brasiliensis]QUS59038.1 hypothetical protein KGB56_25830 [Pseudovibrio brasiliensis]